MSKKVTLGTVLPSTIGVNSFRTYVDRLCGQDLRVLISDTTQLCSLFPDIYHLWVLLPILVPQLSRIGAALITAPSLVPVWDVVFR